ncbi:MAG: hypothetical protein C0622_07965 [Desulfuromonas sp.]|nr:MAG: hypothetical protein C0622_07965 [Desulfuromonas sp.]
MIPVSRILVHCSTLFTPGTERLFILRRMFWTLLLTIITVCFLGGCAPNYEQMVSSLQQAPVSCPSLSAVSWEKIALNEDRYLAVDVDDPVYRFPEGKSYFKAFELPPFAHPYHVVVSSYALDDGSGPQKMYAFSPLLLTLNSNFEVVRRSRPRHIRAQRPSFAEVTNVSLSAAPIKLDTQLPFTAANKGERYLVVLTSEEQLSSHSEYIKTDVYGFPQTTRLKNSPTGRIRVSLVEPRRMFTDYIGNQNRKVWLSDYETVERQRRYEGQGFSVMSPRGGSYKVQTYIEKRWDYLMHSFVAFVSYTREGFGYGIVESSERAQAPALIENSIRQNLLAADVRSSNLVIDGAACRRIDFFGRDPNQLLFPVRGYSIECKLPGLNANQEYPLYYRIKISYWYGLNESTATLPHELQEFYQTVKFTYRK